MRNLLKVAVVGAALVASSVAMTQPAMASDLSWNVSDGAISYSDSKNKFCARAYDSEGARQVKVTVTAVGKPTIAFIDKNNYYGHSGGRCVYLTNYREDTRLTVTAATYWGERGTWVNRRTKSFSR
ncbi:hypothetical protein [Streptosporangium sp. KLBMP 9127]|nr:hypothetical protein [Streptosporangium sp. KLBMP 9127]